MGSGSKRPGGSEEKPIRPLLLAGVLGLMWFVLMQEGGFEEDVPSWGVPVVLGVRLLADFVGGWVAISLLQLVFGFVRLALAQLRTRGEP